MHAEIRIGDSPIMLADEMPEMGGKGPKSYGGTPVSFFIYQENVDEAWKRAIKAGGKEVMPLADQFWGDRGGCFEDPFGHKWWLAQHVKDMSPGRTEGGGGLLLLVPRAQRDVGASLYKPDGTAGQVACRAVRLFRPTRVAIAAPDATSSFARQAG